MVANPMFANGICSFLRNNFPPIFRMLEVEGAKSSALH
jgi:hypothetical protein